MDELREAAQRYARHNYRVFPCRPGSKEPMIAGGFKGATSKHEVVQDWWTKWSKANIGWAIPEGMLVVDVDPRNGGEVPALLPNTRDVYTPGGGMHLYYGVPEDLSFWGHWPGRPGVDIKAGGKGYVLLPPSKLAGYVEVYTWALSEDAEVELPQDILNILIRPDAPRFSEGIDAGPPKFLPWETGTTGGMAYLAKVLDTMREAPEGQRNNTLNRCAWSLLRLVRQGDLAEEKALMQLRDAALVAGLSYEEAARTLLSAYGGTT